MERLKVSDFRTFEDCEGKTIQLGNSDSASLYRIIRVLPRTHELEVEKVNG